MEEQEIRESDQSEFNSGLASLQRLHEIKKWIDFATIRNNPHQLFNHLKAFYKELNPILSQDKKGQHKSERELQKDMLEKCEKGFKDLLNNEIEVEAYIQLLDDWELQLRDLEQAHGLNMPLKSDGRFALGRKR